MELRKKSGLHLKQQYREREMRFCWPRDGKRYARSLWYSRGIGRGVSSIFPSLLQCVPVPITFFFLDTPRAAKSTKSNMSINTQYISRVGLFVVLGYVCPWITLCKDAAYSSMFRGIGDRIQGHHFSHSVLCSLQRNFEFSRVKASCKRILIDIASSYRPGIFPMTYCFQW
ncbi:unnamed protein product [Discosporangium mesarthrocarpum]